MPDGLADAVEGVPVRKDAPSQHVLAVREERKGEAANPPHDLLAVPEVPVLHDLRRGDQVVPVRPHGVVQEEVHKLLCRGVVGGRGALVLREAVLMKEKRGISRRGGSFRGRLHVE